MPAVLLGLDLGTTRVKALALGADGCRLGAAARPSPLSAPRPGWAETDAASIVEAAFVVAREAVAAAGAPAAAVGIANQRSTAVLWDAATGRPVAPAVSWRCLRAAPAVEALRPRLGARFRALTGLPLTPYWFAPKAAWLLENLPGARAAAAAGRLRLGTLDSYLLFRLTGGDVRATDVSNAARTGLLDLETLAWSEELLDAFRIPRACLSEVRPSAFAFAPSATLGGAPIAGAAGDAGAALLGLAPASAKATLGTGAFVHVAVAARPAPPPGLFAAPAYDLGDRGGVRWSIEASVPSAGAGLEWVRRATAAAPEAFEAALAAAAPFADPDLPVLVPAFTGLGAPTWDAGVRAGVVGLREGDGLPALATAALEAVAFQVADALAALPAVPARLVADGGLARSRALLAAVAALSGAEVVPAAEPDATARGAALLAGIGAGVVDPGAIPPADLGAPVRPDPALAAAGAARRARWRDAVRRLEGGPGADGAGALSSGAKPGDLGRRPPG